MLQQNFQKISKTLIYKSLDSKWEEHWPTTQQTRDQQWEGDTTQTLARRLGQHNLHFFCG